MNAPPRKKQPTKQPPARSKPPPLPSSAKVPVAAARPPPLPLASRGPLVPSKPPPLPLGAKAPPKPRGRKDSAPEIQVDYASAGRDTMAAIAEEVAEVAAVVVQRQRKDSGPQIEVQPGQAGRDTLAAIAGELLGGESVRPDRMTKGYSQAPAPAGRETLDAIAQVLGAEPDTGVRRKMSTLGFEERPRRSNGRTIRDTSPEVITVEETTAGRETLAAIQEELTGQPASRVKPLDESFAIFEMTTFVVRGDVASLASNEARRAFVTERLMHRLPVESEAEIDRIDVTPWTVKGTVIVRVWCRVS